MFSSNPQVTKDIVSNGSMQSDTCHHADSEIDCQILGGDEQCSPQKSSVVGIDDKANDTVNRFKLLGSTNFK
jgi:hypothetical protein